MNETEREIRNGNGDLIIKVKESNCPGDPVLISEHGEIYYHDFQQQILCPEVTKGRKGKAKKPMRPE